MHMQGHKCPNCGNTEHETISSNGAHGEDEVLLCTAAVDRPEDSSFFGVPGVEPQDLAVCGMQWSPTEERTEDGEDADTECCTSCGCSLSLDDEGEEWQYTTAGIAEAGRVDEGAILCNDCASEAASDARKAVNDARDAADEQQEEIDEAGDAATTEMYDRRSELRIELRDARKLVAKLEDEGW